MPLPIIEVNLKNNAANSRVRCVVDSGADFCTFPMAIGQLELQIDFTKVAGNEMNNQWDSVNKSNQEEVQNFMKELSNRKIVMKINTVCACENNTPCYLYPVEMEIGGKSIITPIIWTPKNIPALLVDREFLIKVFCFWI